MATLSSSRKLVFVVDDEANIADTLSLILDHEGFTVRAFYDGSAALEHAQHEAPDIVLSDVAMPKMNGLVLAAKLQAQFPHCQILLISGNAYLVNLGQDNGGPKFEILVKPVHPAVLVGRVKAMAAEAVAAG